MIDCLDSAHSWLNEHQTGPVKQQMRTELAKHRNKKCMKKHMNLEDDGMDKKPPMKTAEDVIKRILWDQNLKVNMFTIGYLDRFLGRLEKDFGEFSWDDIASVDNTVLAIPKHRIQYFKYKDVIVWDKGQRLDNVFGSTGSGVTISEVVEKHVDTTLLDADEDDDVRISCGGGVCEESKAYQEDREEKEVDDTHWQNKMRPNYFICQRVTDADVMEGVEAMQNVILEADPRYAECCINKGALHLTLCTLGLDTQDQVVDACNILRQSKDELSEMSKKDGGIKVEFSGISHFYNRVIYSKVEHEQRFSEFVDHLRALFREAGLEIRDNYDFVPHMTILKVTRPTARMTGKKTVSPWMYEDFKDMKFGIQSLDGLYLCEMTSERDGTGFYMSPIHIDLLENC